MPSTSTVAAAIAVEGLLIQFGNGASPEVFTTVANVGDVTLPLKADTVDITNVGDLWHRRISTLLDMGTIKMKVFWTMTEPTHENLVTGSIRGIRYLFINKILANVKVIYPDGFTSTDSFAAYVTSFSITGKVGGVFEAEVELANSGQPTMVYFMAKAQAIPWPEITVGGERYTLRLSYASNYQLTVWGKNLASATAIELAAAMAGRFDDSGKWRSAGFERPVDLADLMEAGDEAALIQGCTEAIKKVYPETEVTPQPVPETASTAAVTDSLNSGLLQSQAAGSD